jgi:hypothetical protein
VEKHVRLSKYTAKDATINYKEISPSTQHFKHQNNPAETAAILDWEQQKQNWRFLFSGFKQSTNMLQTPKNVKDPQKVCLLQNNSMNQIKLDMRSRSYSRLILSLKLSQRNELDSGDNILTFQKQL